MANLLAKASLMLSGKDPRLSKLCSPCGRIASELDDALVRISRGATKTSIKSPFHARSVGVDLWATSDQKACGICKSCLGNLRNNDRKAVSASSPEFKEAKGWKELDSILGVSYLGDSPTSSEAGTRIISFSRDLYTADSYFSSVTMITERESSKSQ
jgi:hypothetical protein